MGRAQPAAVVAITTCVVALIAAPADAQFEFPSPPATFSMTPHGTNDISPSAAIDGDGRAFAAWDDFPGDRLRVSERAPGASAFSQLFSVAPDGTPLMGVDGAGNLTIVWHSMTDGIRAVYRPRGGPF